jgi:hypothetical protein
LKNFVLDENIILLAAKSEDLNGNRNYTCLQVIFDILRKCDIINCSQHLIEKYQKKLNNLERIGRPLLLV